MSDCKHEWQMGMIWCGCTPGVEWAEMECTRCGARKRERVTPELFRRGCQDMIERLELEIAYLEKR